MVNDALGRRASGLLAPVESQGSCGSCWAFAATHTFTDARSIAAGSRTPPLSAQFPTSCITPNDYLGTENGCCGGDPAAAFDYFKTVGAVTQTCAPYEEILEMYNYDETEGAVNPSISHTCPATCNDNTLFNPSNIRLHGLLPVSSEAEVIAALDNGPVMAGIQLLEDFYYFYRCGIFCQENDDFLEDGLHAVEIVDYGTESGVDFWVVKNSWGTNSGEDGYFRIRRGDLNAEEYHVPVVSSGQNTIIRATSSRPYCSPHEVANPGADELIMSAITHAVEEINQRNAIPCPENGQATSVAFNSVTEAYTQIVDGIVITTEIVVDILGCARRANVFSTVMLQDDNTFDLTNFRYSYVGNGNNDPGNGNNDPGNSGGFALPSSVTIMMIVIVTAFYFYF